MDLLGGTRNILQLENRHSTCAPDSTEASAVGVRMPSYEGQDAREGGMGDQLYKLVRSLKVLGHESSYGDTDDFNAIT